MLKRLIKQKAYLIIGYAFLLSVHFIFKDRFKPFIPFFNAFPLIIILLFGYYSTLRIRKQKRLASGILILNLVLSVFWFNNYYYKTQATTDTTNSLSILYWNVAKRDHIPLDVIFKQIEQLHPEIIAMVEAKRKTQQAVELFKIYAPEYEVHILEAQMMIAVKGTVDSIQYHELEKTSKFNFIAAQINNKPFKIMITDLLASPTHSKKSNLKNIRAFAEANHVDCIAGDFNTPYESYYFKELKSNFESFHAYNNGFTATWPFGYPLLEIDHIWLSKKWQPIRLDKAYFKNSDHALLKATFHKKQTPIPYISTSVKTLLKTSLALNLSSFRKS